MGNNNRLMAVLLTLFVGLVCGVLPQFRFWQDLEAKGYDLLTLLTAPEKSVLPITIVGVDEASFAHLNQRWPWSRKLHAKLVDQLTAAGAAVIVFDIVFSEPAGAKGEDKEFAAAIKRSGSVVLASDYVYQESESARQWLRVEPHPRFIEAGAMAGLAGSTIDGDTILRRFPTYPDAMWLSAVKTLQRTRPGIVETEPVVGNDARIRHLGPPHTFPYVSYYKVLNGEFPPGYFQDQIVLIGRDLRANPEVGMAQADLFATPFIIRDKQLVPGVEMHATLIENALTGQIIYPVERQYTVLLLAAAICMLIPAMLRFHPLGSGLWTAALASGVAGGGYWLFLTHHLWLQAIHVMVAMVLAYVSVGLWSYLQERRKAVQIKSAFSKYVSRDVVDQMIAHPDRLKLGGERRELTLLFTDLAGFTSISEKLPPDTVASLINLYLTEMTQVIMGQRGTVDKFIGDSVMAFWGAPLPDEDHALHAVTAAAAMQDAMQRLQPRFAELGVEEVHQRIGLHTGEAIVGNMGSIERFDYTALGDTVNLASRLEGANKPYGTGILLSETTAQAVKGRLGLRQVDRVRVKGKQQPIDIYTPSEDKTLNELTEKALAAYREGHWAQARAAWQAVVAYRGDDPLPAVFLARIDALEQEAPADWEGVVSLEK